MHVFGFIIETKMSKDTVKEERFIKDLFRVFDVNKNGTISKSEVEKALRATGNPTKAEVAEVLAEMKWDGVKDITYDKFAACISKYLSQKKSTEQLTKDYRDAFKVFDKNNDGFINKAELKVIMTKLGDKLSDKEVEDMIRTVDKDKDGKLSYDEYIKMFVEDM